MVTQAEIQDYAKRLRKEADADEWQCRVADLLLAAYAEPPAPREPDDVIRALQANNGPLSDRERRLAAAAWYAGVAEPKAAPSEIARDAARYRDALIRLGSLHSRYPLYHDTDTVAAWRKAMDAAWEDARRLCFPDAAIEQERNA